MERHMLLLEDHEVVHGSAELWTVSRIRAGTLAHELIIRADWSRFQQAFAEAEMEGSSRFLFRCQAAERRWLGHLESLSHRGPNGVSGSIPMVWTWERVPAECEMLSPRQRDVLLALVDGHTVPQIGRLFGISPNTVRTHLTRCQLVTHCRDQTQLLRWAQTNRFTLALLVESS